MARHTTLTLSHTTNCYDDCLISACLKKLFSKTDVNKDGPGFTISTSVAEVRKELEQLNSIGRRDISYAYLTAMERTIPGAEMRYVVIYEKAVPVLFCYFQLFTLSSANFNLEKNKGFVKGIFRFLLGLKKLKVLFAGNAMRCETAACCYNETVMNADAAAELIASAAEKIAAENKAEAIILKDFQASAAVAKWFKSKGYQVPWQDNVMVMAIDPGWDSLTDYVGVLSRKYKTRANKILQAGGGTISRDLSEQEIRNHGKDIDRLFKNVTNNQSFVLAVPGSEHFAELKSIYKNDFEFFGFYHGDKMVAFYCAFVNSDAYELYYVGFDYQLNNEYHLYFNMLFAGLSRAIQLKKLQLKLGRTSFDAKASLGAKPIAMSYFIKTSGIPAAVVNWFVNYFSSVEDGKWKLRNPLK